MRWRSKQTNTAVLMPSVRKSEVPKKQRSSDNYRLKSLTVT